MLPKRMSVKFFVSESPGSDLSKFVPIFQRWIQRRAVEGLLIDVADYKHVPEGPGMILIGHEGDYSYDLGEGRPGLMYVRKREVPETFADYLRLIFRLALVACQKLENEKSLTGIRFDYSEAKITLLDRLNTPNTPEGFQAVRDDFHAFLTQLYGTDSLILESAHDDPRECLAVRVRVPDGISLDALLEHLVTDAPVAK